MAISGTNQVVYKNNIQLGLVTAISYGGTNTGDWACVRITNSGYSMTNKVNATSSSNYYSITGSQSSVCIGDIINKYGYVSGYATVQVTNINVTKQYTNGVYVSGLTEATITTGSSTYGDSGGPYYIYDNSTSQYKFVGVHDAHTGSTVYFMPYGKFMSCFTPKTTP